MLTLLHSRLVVGRQMPGTLSTRCVSNYNRQILDQGDKIGL